MYQVLVKLSIISTMSGRQHRCLGQVSSDKSGSLCPGQVTVGRGGAVILTIYWLVVAIPALINWLIIIVITVQSFVTITQQTDHCLLLSCHAS